MELGAVTSVNLAGPNLQVLRMANEKIQRCIDGELWTLESKRGIRHSMLNDS